MGAQCVVAACLQMHTRYKGALLSAMPSQTLISGPDHWQLCVYGIILQCEPSFHRAYSRMMPGAADLVFGSGAGSRFDIPEQGPCMCMSGCGGWTCC